MLREKKTPLMAYSSCQEVIFSSLLNVFAMCTKNMSEYTVEKNEDEQQPRLFCLKQKKVSMLREEHVTDIHSQPDLEGKNKIFLQYIRLEHHAVYVALRVGGFFSAGGGKCIEA